MSEIHQSISMTPSIAVRELARSMIGDKIGEGQFREVFEFPHDRSCVVKVEDKTKCFSNVLEWDTWLQMFDTELGKRWLAPCVWISSCGIVLLQRRTMPITANQMPDKVPAFFEDVKLDNWGLYEGKVVCHDYALHAGTRLGFNNRMRKVQLKDIT